MLGVQLALDISSTGLPMSEFGEDFDRRGGLPWLWWPRSYQARIFADWERGIRRFITVWPRRGGKDQTWLNFIIARMAERPGTYIHIFPEKAMGKKIIWDELTGGGFSFLEHFPPALCLDDTRRGRNETEMTVTFKNGSVYRIEGADMPDRLRGTNCVGIVFSECSQMNRKPWDIIEPILNQNGGWAGFNSTPDGRNNLLHFMWKGTMDEEGRGDPDWHRSLYTIEDIVRDGIGFRYEEHKFVPYREDGSKLISDAQLQRMRTRALRTGQLSYIEDWINQEYYCSFNAARVGAYYGSSMQVLRKDGRLCRNPYDPRYPVQTVWDLGIADHTAIIFFQNIGRTVSIIDYHEESGRGMPHYLGIVKSKPYAYAAHWAPHDIEVRDFGSGKSRWETARDLGIVFRIVPSMSIQDGIDAARNVLPRTYIDQDKCDGLVQCLENYHSEFSDKMDELKPHPVHDRWSHGADAFRYLAIAADIEIDSRREGMQVTSQTEFDPLLS